MVVDMASALKSFVALAGPGPTADERLELSTFAEDDLPLDAAKQHV